MALLASQTPWVGAPWYPTRESGNVHGHGHGTHSYRVGGKHMESDQRLYGGLSRVRPLLCPANHLAVSANVSARIRPDASRTGPRSAPSLEVIAARVRQLDERSVSR